MSIHRILSEDRDRDRSRILHPLSPFFQQGNLGSELPVNAECLIKTIFDQNQQANPAGLHGVEDSR